MILVTGGGGFLGSHLVEALVADSAEVRVLELSSARCEHLPLDRIELIRGDIRDRDQVRSAVQGCDAVYHLAANPNLWTRDRRDFDAVNHQGTTNVLTEALDAGARRVLHVSTESILTSRRFQGGPVESLRLAEDDMVGPYCLSKFRAEQVAWGLADQHQPVLIASPTLPIGPGDRGRSPPTQLTLACCRGTLRAFLECRFNMIDARDVARGLMLTMANGVPGKRYLLGGGNLRLSEWLTMVAERTGVRPPRWRVPYPIALAVAHASEFFADNLTGRMPIATVTGVRLTRYCMHFDPSATLAELGLEPRPIADSIGDAIAWYRQMGWI